MSSRRFLALASVVLFCALPSFAQERGSITGIITDPTGAAVPSAKVTAIDTATARAQTTSTTSVGLYTIPELVAGTYKLTVEKTGFKEAVADNVSVVVNTTTRIDLTLNLGATTQTVEVTAAAALLQTDRTDVGSTLTSSEINNLPLTLSGGLRSPTSFVILAPGVANTPQSGGGDIGIRVAGGMSYDTSQLYDGGEMMSGRQNGPPINLIPVDAVQEFKMVTGSYSAEYGRTGNGVENFVSKSGGNQIHGDGFEMNRNTAFNARGFYPATVPVNKQNDFGGSVGGPVFLPKIFDGRDKAFFFFSLERSKYEAGSPSGLTSVPTAAMKNGDFTSWVNSAGAMIPLYDPATTATDPVTGAITRQPMSCSGAVNVICPSRIDPTAAYLMSLLPNPTLPGIFNNIPVVGSGGETQQTFNIKGDWSASAKSHFAGSYGREFYGSPATEGPIPSVLGANFATSGKSDLARFSHDYTLGPSLLNHFIFSGNWTRYLEYSSITAAKGGPYTMTAAERSAIQLKGIPGDPNAASEYQLGDGYPQLNMWVGTNSPDRTWMIEDTVNKISGRHSMKFGFEYLHTLFARKDCNQCAGEADFSDAITGLPGSTAQTGSSLAGFLLGLPSYGAYNLGGFGNENAPYYGWFFQDDFKVNSKLTLNLGLRYDIDIPPTERRGEVGNVCLWCANPDANGILGAVEFGGVGPGRTGLDRFTDSRKNGWGPRIGFAYQVTPTTVFRAGAGLFYDPPREGGNADTHNTGFAGYRSVFQPNSYTQAFTLAQGFPTPVPAPTIDPGMCSVNSSIGCNPWLQYPYSGYAPRLGTWNATAEHRFGNNTLVRAAYEGTVGVSLWSEKEVLDQTPSQDMALGSMLLQPLSSVLGTPAGNAAGIKLPFASFPTDLTVAQALLPYPQYYGFSQAPLGDTAGHSTYHALELSVEHQMSHGLWINANYTWSKTIGNTQGGNPGLGGFVGNGDSGTQDEYDRRADKAVSPGDVPHRLVITYVYNLPVGRGKHFLGNTNAVADAVLGGWRVSGVQQYQSGVPIWITSNQTTGLLNHQMERANVNWGTPLKNSAWNGDPNAGIPYLNPAAFSRPAEFTFGNSPAAFSNLRNPGYLNEDLSLAKDFSIMEKVKLTIQANFFNAFNRVILAGPNTSLESAAFGLISSQTGDPNSGIPGSREIQLSGRITF
jgi:hypothetical protein